MADQNALVNAITQGMTQMQNTLTAAITNAATTMQPPLVAPGSFI